LTRAVRERAPRAALVSLLEGGYDPPRLAEAALRHAEALAAPGH
jgi:acetoin utilization deacetylase AcuC-like enzyme